MKKLRIGRPSPGSIEWKTTEYKTKWLSYTNEELSFLRNNYLKYSDLELSQIFNRTVNAISGVRSRHELNRERKAPFKVTLRNAIREAQLMRETWAITQDMKALITICELDISNYKKEQFKKELLKLSNFNVTKIKPLKC